MTNPRHVGYILIRTCEVCGCKQRHYCGGKKLYEIEKVKAWRCAACQRRAA